MVRLVYADIQLHYSGIAVPAPYGDYPGGRLPDTLAMSRASTQKALYALLMQHPTAANITVWPGTVRGVRASNNQSSIQSVIVHKLDGTQVVVDNIGLVVGEYFFLTWDSQTELICRLHRKDPSRD